MDPKTDRIVERINRVAKRVVAIVEEWIREGDLRCNCGGPQYGTAHSPDCDLTLAEDRAQGIAEDEEGV